jgi:hypothetical protein
MKITHRLSLVTELGDGALNLELPIKKAIQGEDASEPAAALAIPNLNFVQIILDIKFRFLPHSKH